MGAIEKPIFIALDCDDFSTAKAIIDETYKVNNYYKVGLESFYAFGPEVCEYLNSLNAHIFLDLKLHDIPTTVYKSLKVVLSRFKVSFINIHALGGIEMMEAAKKAISETSPSTKLLAVTILTSHDQETIKTELGITKDLKKAVVQFAKNAIDSGLDGVVASAEESKLIKEIAPKDFNIVTPGIRYQASSHDQKRVVTPFQAFNNGSTHIVMGREIVKNPEPYKILKLIKESIHGQTTESFN